jgi:ABC-type glycerol-3-phosphate transport system substrate-binding protein
MDAFLKAAEAIHKGGKVFGLGCGTTADNVDTWGAIFASFGAELVDKDGKIQIKSAAVRQALEYSQKLVKFLPADAQSWDDSSNNRALIAGNAAFIYNPPSAWAVAVRDAPAVSCIESLWSLKGHEMYRKQLRTASALINSLHQDMNMLCISPEQPPPQPQPQPQQQAESKSRHHMKTRSQTR